MSGGPTGAQSGKLAIWVGGDRPTYERYESVLRAIGDQPLYIGTIGAGTVAKLAHNCGSFAIHAAMAEVFTLGVKAGVEPLALFRTLARHWLTLLAAYVLVFGLVAAAVQPRGFEWWVGLNLWAAFLHYAYDGIIWKSRPPAKPAVSGA